MKFTYSKYDKLQEELLEIQNPDPSWWPDMKDMEHVDLSDDYDFLEFLLWLTLTADPPQTESDKLSRKFINRILYQKIVLDD